MKTMVHGLTVDTTGIVSDGARWIGPVTISFCGESVTAQWIGCHGSEYGTLDPAEGESETLCTIVDEHEDAIESAIRVLLEGDDPRSAEQRAADREAIEIERAIDERLVKAA